MKLGLAIEGGANRSVFSSGIMDGLLDLHIVPNYVTGVSAGIAYGINFLSGQRGRSIDIISKFIDDPRYMGILNLLNPNNGSYFNINFLFDIIPNQLIPFDYDAFSKYNGIAEAVVTDVNTGHAAYLPISIQDKQFLSLRASCALPLLFPIIEVNGEQYMDGGIVNPIPFQRVLEVGCDRVIVICTREQDYIQKQEKVLHIATMMYRKLPNFVEAIKQRAEVYNKQMEKLRELERRGEVFVFRPYSTKGFFMMERSIEKINRLWKSGVNQVHDRKLTLIEYLNK